ncbi:MAG: glycosyltransferase [Coprobacillus cateniformis]
MIIKRSQSDFFCRSARSGQANYHQIQAFAQVADEFPDVIFNIYGSGNLKESLQSLIDKLGMTKRIILKGKQPRLKVYQVIVYLINF